MTRYTFYIAKRKLTCEYVDKYNKLYVLENEEAIERLTKVSRYKYNKVNLEEDVADFYASSTIVTIEGYNRVLKKYKNERLSFLITKQTILSKLAQLVMPSKIFIFYLPTILIGVKLLNLPEEPTLYGEGIDIIKELGESIDMSELDTVEEKIVDENISKSEDFDISNSYTYNIDIDCYDKGESDDTKYVIEKYGDIIEKLSNRYGFSSNLIIGMVTQESHGVHENLMQVTFNLNNDYISKRYNFEKNKYETIVLTNSPEEYPDVDIVITEEMMKEPYYAILAGINALRINFDEYASNNICSAIGMYNKGYGNWMKVLKNTSKSTGVPIEEILYNPSDLSYVAFDDNLKVGDPRYLENVMQYVPNTLENGIYVKTIDNVGNIEMIKWHVNKTLGRVNKK